MEFGNIPFRALFQNALAHCLTHQIRLAVLGREEVESFSSHFQKINLHPYERQFLLEDDLKYYAY